MKSEKLQTRSSTGRKQPWGEMKVYNELLAKAHERLMPERAEKLRQCAQRITTVTRKDLPEGKYKILAYFCKIRLCPMCTWRRSLKVSAQMRQLIGAVETDKPRGYIMLTTTLKNCYGDELSDTITHLTKAFNALTQSTPFIRATIGYYRGVEVTYNKKTGMYHPHIHAILVVNKSYFSSKDYLSHSQWTAMWQRCLRVDYTPQVNVKRIHGGDLQGAVSEVAKYTVKPGDMLMPDDWDLTEEVVMTLTAALHKRRLVSFGGILKDYHRDLHLSNPDDPEQDKNIDDFWNAAPDQFIYKTYVWDAFRTGFWLESVEGGKKGA